MVFPQHYRMATVTTGPLVPPRSLFSDDNTLVVSTKRPAVVYFTKLMEMISAKITAPAGVSVFEFRVVGAGAAIPRCEQVTRYALQQLRGKYKHLVKVAEKRTEKSTTVANDLTVPEMVDEESIFHMTVSKRSVDIVCCSIVVTLS